MIDVATEVLALDLEALTAENSHTDMFRRVVECFGGEVYPGRHGRIGAACRGIQLWPWSMGSGRHWASGPRWLHDVGDAYGLARAVAPGGRITLDSCHPVTKAIVARIDLAAPAIGQGYGSHANKPQLALCAAAVRAWGRLHP